MDTFSSNVDYKLTDDLVDDILASKEPKIDIKRAGFVISSSKDPIGKAEYLNAIYRADASMLGSTYRAYRSQKSELPVSSDKLSYGKGFLVI
jgi:hypothetical protein